MWLIGMMGSGKSTVGRLTADRLGAPFYDTDRLVEESAGKAIADIWRTQGEMAFRQIETAVIKVVPDDGVVAAGGGAVTDEANRAVIARSEVVVWLRVDGGELVRRATAGDEVRPLLTTGEAEAHTLRRLLEERAPLYGSLSTHDIDTTLKDIDEVVSEVVSLWPH